jgi:hypothetical protein
MDLDAVDGGTAATRLYIVRQLWEVPMSERVTEEARARLAHQALGRPLDTLEKGLARALEEIFASGEHDLGVAVKRLEEKGIKRPSGAAGAWTLAILEQELARINASLDEAYASGATAFPLEALS